MAIAEELKVLIRAETQGAVQELKKLDKTTKSTGKQMAGMVKQMLGIGTAIFAVQKTIRVFADITRESVRAASDLEEVNNKFAVTFRDVAGEAESAADEISRAYRMSERESKALLSSTGDLLTGFGFTSDAALDMSDQVTRLAADLASFQNIEGGAERASQALTSALLGETESAKSLGIVIRQADVEARLLEKGLESLTGEAKLQAEAQARLEIAMSQSKNAIGDLERSADSYANQSRALESATEDLKSAFGQLLLPTIAEAKGAFTGMLTSITDNIQAANELRNVQMEFKGDGTDSVEKQLDLYYSQVAVQQENNRLTEEQLELLDEKHKRQQESINLSEVERKNQKATFALTGEAEGEEAEALKAKKLALERIEELRIAGLSNAEKEIEKVQEEINKWAEIRSTVAEGTEAYRALDGVISKLAGRRSELKESLSEPVKEATEEVKQAEIDLTENAFMQMEERVNNFQMSQEKMQEIREARAEAEKQIAKDTAEEEKRQLEQVKQSAQTAFGFMGDIASLAYDAQIAAAEEGSEKQKQLMRERAGMEKAMAVFSSIINTAEAITAALTAGPILGPILAGIIGGLGVAKTALIASQPIPSFAEGGSFIADRPQLMQVGDNPAQRERVTVEPMNGGSGGQQMRVIVNLGPETLYDRLTEASKNGQFIIDARSIE